MRRERSCKSERDAGSREQTHGASGRKKVAYREGEAMIVVARWARRRVGSHGGGQSGEGSGSEGEKIAHRVVTRWGGHTAKEEMAQDRN
jgi:hypothetical protein